MTQKLSGKTDRAVRTSTMSKTTTAQSNIKGPELTNVDKLKRKNQKLMYINFETQSSFLLWETNEQCVTSK